jgi:tRNA-dihydrouridine synthase 3
MGRPARLEHIVKSIKAVTDIPLTVKMRTGLQEEHGIAHTLLPKLAKWNVAMCTVSENSVV